MNGSHVFLEDNIKDKREKVNFQSVTLKNIVPNAASSNTSDPHV